jgi:uncharacterized protein GlcG (DUF336 family)
MTEANSSFAQQSITEGLAQRVVEAGRAASEEVEIPMSIAVVDQSGNLKAFTRMDGASISSIDLATDKAFTVISLGLGISTANLFDFIKEDAPLQTGIPARDRMVALGGGSPIKVDGDVVGAIGVSGGHYTDDMKVVERTLASLDLEG